MIRRDNDWRLFNILPGRKFDFLVNSKPSRGGAWVVTLAPLSAAAQRLRDGSM